jgi:hypothetical protein
MAQAAQLHALAPMLLPGITVNTTPTEISAAQAIAHEI